MKVFGADYLNELTAQAQCSLRKRQHRKTGARKPWRLTAYEARRAQSEERVKRQKHNGKWETSR
jgi:hypothetical protein